MNKSLLSLTEEDNNFTDASPALFGLEFAQKSKELVDQMKAMWSSSGYEDNSFFWNGPPTARGTTTPSQEGA